ncbi:hypothetical protein E2C01_093909 [Portunus trituberculatus]|uniref:Uncharacterized protein n=1 Tax=Portunus trituberculatus TaxID=210409 RepID=A0A5B7JW51_PORTR|nr:hypothetical protein [Portunus trituberculatus]
MRVGEGLSAARMGGTQTLHHAWRGHDGKQSVSLLRRSAIQPESRKIIHTYILSPFTSLPCSSLQHYDCEREGKGLFDNLYEYLVKREGD